MDDLIRLQVLQGPRDVEYDLFDDVWPERLVRRSHPEGGYVGTHGIKDEAQVWTSGSIDLEVVPDLGDVLH